MAASKALRILHEESEIKGPDNAESIAKGTMFLVTDDYELNQEKAMMNKVLAASRSNVDYQITEGGHVVTLNAGMYESFKAALPDFYDQHPDYTIPTEQSIKMQSGSHSYAHSHS